MDINDSFFAIRLIIRYGNTASKVFALLAALLTGFFLWADYSWWGVFAALPVAALVFLLVKSYVELINIVFHMLN